MFSLIRNHLSFWFKRPRAWRTALAGLALAALLAGCAGTGEPTAPVTELTPDKADDLPGTSWVVERILSKPASSAESILQFSTAGQVSGNTGCNGIQGSVTIEGQSMTFGPIAATRRMCAPAVNGQEIVFLEALDLTRSWQKSGKVLELLDDNGNVVMILIAT